MKKKLGVIATALLFMPAFAGAGEVLGPTIALTCNACHGTKGVSAGRENPSIAGLDATYLTNVMLQYKKGERFSAVMGRHFKGKTDSEIAEVAKVFASEKWVSAKQKTDAKLVKRGKAVHAEKCALCHGPNGEMNNVMTPRLAGQWAEYLDLEMQKYADATMKSAPSVPPIMVDMLRKTSAEDIKALAQFYASQK